MNPATLRARFGYNFFRRSWFSGAGRRAEVPTVLVATVDPIIRDGVSTLLEASPMNAIWVGSVGDVKAIVSREKIAACLCGFWLQDGTYREVVRHLRRERLDLPTIILSSPVCPNEYGEYLVAANIGAVDFLPFPYKRSEFDRLLAPVIGRDSEVPEEGLPHLQFQERGAA